MLNMMTGTIHKNMLVRHVHTFTFPLVHQPSTDPPHSNLHFIATTLPWGDSGETLFNQMFRAVATRDWLFQYGAMPFSAIIPDSLWKVRPSL